MTRLVTIVPREKPYPGQVQSSYFKHSEMEYRVFANKDQNKLLRCFQNQLITAIQSFLPPG